MEKVGNIKGNSSTRLCLWFGEFLFSD